MSHEVLDRIEKRLKAVGLKEATAAKQAGLSDSAIRNTRRRIAAGEPEAGFSMKTLEALAPILKTTISWLADGIGDEEALPDQVELNQIYPRLKPSDQEYILSLARRLAAADEPEKEE